MYLDAGLFLYLTLTFFFGFLCEGRKPALSVSEGRKKLCMAEYNSLEKISLQKVEELRAEGVEPYPTRAQRTHTSAQAIAEFEAGEANTLK
jgi:hypothetical protein